MMGHRESAIANLNRANEAAGSASKSYSLMAIAHGILALVEIFEQPKDRDSFKLYYEGEPLTTTSDMDVAELTRAVENLTGALERIRARL